MPEDSHAPLSHHFAAHSATPGPHGQPAHPHWLRISIISEGQKQPVIAESMVAEWSSSIGLCNPRSWIRVRMDVFPKGLKLSPIVAEIDACGWCISSGLCNPHSCVLVRMAIISEGLNTMASFLPYRLASRGRPGCFSIPG